MLAGVADDGNVIGMSRTQIASLDSLLMEVSTDTIKPPVRIRTHHQELSDGKLVVLAEVPESDSAHESPGGCIEEAHARCSTSDAPRKRT